MNLAVFVGWSVELSVDKIEGAMNLGEKNNLHPFVP